MSTKDNAFQVTYIVDNVPGYTLFNRVTQAKETSYLVPAHRVFYNRLECATLWHFFGGQWEVMESKSPGCRRGFNQVISIATTD